MTDSRPERDPVSDDAYEEMDDRIAAHFDRVRALLDDALDASADGDASDGDV